MQETLLPIQAVARKLEIPEKYLEQLGSKSGKVKLELLSDPTFKRRGKLIIVTATTPTAAGEGKTVTSISLTQGLAHIGKSVVITSREPSLGPVFGMKGGAAGGGLSQIEPSAKINLHFHGDFHAIASAHNLLAALIDAHLFHGNDLHLDPERITWPRTIDMNDRALRRIAVSLDSKKEGSGRQTGFIITAASEIMAIVALAKDLQDLRRRLDCIVVAVTRDGKPVSACDLGATGGMMALLAEAILPNLVQTTDGTTVRSIRNQGEGADFERGLPNLGKHIEILQKFGVPTIAAINRFPTDTDDELNRVAAYCAERGVDSALSEGFAKGGPGAKDLAEKVVQAIAKNPAPAAHPLYSPGEPFTEKIQRVAKSIYGASGVNFSEQAKAKLQQFTEWGYGKLPVCMAKTQYSLSDDPKRLGAPAGWTLNVNNASLSAGAGFVVVISGNMMLMPGLPKVWRGSSIDVDDSGAIIGV
ncbi:MAG: formate--tetrahydrofolate ligase [Acidobacteria bacterium]|nr:MAG: formate--tetrahydrofolate ligase [Acidobacteriota bacterium]